jgi:hypothetical protein
VAIVGKAATPFGLGVVLQPDGLEIQIELSFNEWRRLGEALNATLDRALWSTGDWWLYGARWKKDYAHGLDEATETFYFAKRSSRTSRTFPIARRRELPFKVHELLTSFSSEDQERWLDEVERQGWTYTSLRRALEEEKEARRE